VRTLEDAIAEDGRIVQRQTTVRRRTRSVSQQKELKTRKRRTRREENLGEEVMVRMHRHLAKQGQGREIILGGAFRSPGGRVCVVLRGRV
jgi:hypothetical protein